MTTFRGSCRSECRAYRQSVRRPASSVRDARPIAATQGSLSTKFSYALGEVSLMNASTSAGSGGSPVRSRLRRRASVRLSASGAGDQSVLFQFGEDKAINGIAYPFRIFDLRQGRACRREIRPVLLIFCALRNPFGERSDLLRASIAYAFRRAA